MGAKIPEWDEKGLEIQMRWGFGGPIGNVMDREPVSAASVGGLRSGKGMIGGIDPIPFI
jgi:hypothetical protein